MTDFPIVDKINEIQAINTNSLKIATALNEIGTPAAKTLSLAISSSVLMINIECTKILMDYKRLIEE
jgi:hypothetical protein